MFRKVSKKRKPSSAKARIRDEDDNDDDADAEEATSIHQRIQQTQKKHKLLASLPIADKSGSNKRRFLQPLTDELATSDDTANDLSVLAQKHKQAMDEFIKEKLDPSDNKQEKDSAEAANALSVDPETALYQELAASTVPSQVLNASADDDNDAKGAMLVGGTGIAEVILPKAVAFDNSKYNANGIRYSRNPQLSSAVGGGASSSAKSDSNLLPAAGFRSMVPGSKDQPAAIAPQSADRNNAPTESSLPPPKNDEVDESRPGFASRFSSRKGGNVSTSASASSGPTTMKPRGQQHQRDQEVFSKFVKRQRDGRR